MEKFEQPQPKNLDEEIARLEEEVANTEKTLRDNPDYGHPELLRTDLHRAKQRLYELRKAREEQKL